MFDIGINGVLINVCVFVSGIIEMNCEGVFDGMKCDSVGNVYVIVLGGIWVYDF